jgi:hypothetical protein
LDDCGEKIGEEAKINGVKRRKRSDWPQAKLIFMSTSPSEAEHTVIHHCKIIIEGGN